MADPKQTIWETLVEWLAKGLMWAASITIGVVAKIAFDSRNSQLTWKAIAIKATLSIFVGYLAAVICEIYGWKAAGRIVVPVATLLGEALIIYAMTNWYSILSRHLPKIFPKKK